MASSGKKKTTMAKLTRESKLRQRRLDKQVRKDARKHGAATQVDPEQLGETLGEPTPLGAAEPALEPVGQGMSEAAGSGPPADTSDSSPDRA